MSNKDVLQDCATRIERVEHGLRVIDKILALQKKLEAATVFQPITPDTPTGYGNDILLWVKGSRPWIDYLGGSDMSDAQCRRDSPTHWAPLPKTPEG